jgi:hypothetical protein
MSKRQVTAECAAGRQERTNKFPIRPAILNTKVNSKFPSPSPRPPRSPR